MKGISRLRSERCIVEMCSEAGSLIATCAHLVKKHARECTLNFFSAQAEHFIAQSLLHFLLSIKITN
jgi:hypothetical protein